MRSEIGLARDPVAVALAADGKRAFVSHAFGSRLSVVELAAADVRLEHRDGVAIAKRDHHASIAEHHQTGGLAAGLGVGDLVSAVHVHHADLARVGIGDIGKRAVVVHCQRHRSADTRRAARWARTARSTARARRGEIVWLRRGELERGKWRRVELVNFAVAAESDGNERRVSVAHAASRYAPRCGTFPGRA